MLASFFATNYALYSSAQGHRSMYYNPVSCPPPQSSGYMSPSSVLRYSMPADYSTKQRANNAQKTHEKVKFSIDSILAEKEKTIVKDDKEDEEIQVDDDCSVEEDDRPAGDDATDSEHFSWLQCTRYKPPKLPRMKKKDGVKKRKLGRNPRVPFTQHQVAVLEQKFRRTHYLSSMDVAELSTALNLTETRVKIWFQNRRARERRDREALHRGQVIQPRSNAGNSVSGVSWNFPSPHTAFMNFRDTLQLSNVSFPAVSLPK